VNLNKIKAPVASAIPLITKKQRGGVMTTNPAHTIDTGGASNRRPPYALGTDSGSLKEALEQLESCLETPVVPGELPEWAAALSQACGPAKNALRREIQEIHTDQYSKLATKDNDLLQRVAQMREEDVALQEQFEQFEGMVGRMCERAEVAEPHERKADEGLRTLVDKGLELVIRIRKQERALATWYAEAFQRDTGTGD
jgi:hypothetical protein